MRSPRGLRKLSYIIGWIISICEYIKYIYFYFSIMKKHNYNILLKEGASYRAHDVLPILIDLHSRLIWKPVDPDTKLKTFNNVSLRALAEWSYWAKQRFFDRHIKELRKKEAEEAELLQSESRPSDMEAISNIFDECRNLMMSRNEKYGDSWKILSIPWLSNLCEMKLNRISNMDKIDPKIEDELMDTINYCIFALYKVRNP